MKLTKYLSVALFVPVLLVACASAPPSPQDQNDVVAMFQEHPSWYWATQRVQKEYGIPESVQMAIIHQESHFRSDAKTPRIKLLGFIPWAHETSATGYGQALDGTWAQYQALPGNFRKSRQNFSDNADFIGWFAKTQAKDLAHVSPDNAKELYLVYHEGVQGYLHGSYTSKPDVIAIANHVQAQADRYHDQLIAHAAGLPKKSFLNFWS